MLTKYYHFWCDYEFADVDIFVVLQGVPGGTSGEEPTGQCRRQQEARVRSLGGEDALQEGMATHSRGSRGHGGLEGCSPHSFTELCLTETA